MKVAVTNTVALNGGDAAILTALVRMLRAEFGDDIEVTVHDSQPEAASSHLPEFAFRPMLHRALVAAADGNTSGRRRHGWRLALAAWSLGRRLRPLAKIILRREELALLEEYANADLVVSTGGTYLVDRYELEPRLFDYRLTLLMRKPLAFFTQSVGPLTKPRTRRELRRVFSHALLVLLRDERSKDSLESLGVSTERTAVCPDAAFALADPHTLRLAGCRVDGRLEQPRVAISVRDVARFGDGSPEETVRYRDSIGALTRRLVERHDASVTYLSTCQGAVDYAHDDSLVAESIVAELPAAISQRVRVDGHFHTSEQLVERLSGFDLVIATRMHVAILAVVAGTPAIPIAYEPKTEPLARQLGLERWLQRLETLSPSTLSAAAEDFIEALPDLRGPLFSRVAEQREAALAAGALLREAYEGRTSSGRPRQLAARGIRTT